MITIKSSDLAALAQGLLAERAKLLAYVDTQFTRAVHETFSDIVVNTPQYSGTLASNWYIGVQPSAGFIDQRQHPWTGVPDPFQKGDNPAVGTAYSRIAPLYKYGSPVIIYNTAPYVEQVDVGEGPQGRTIRPVNMVDGKVYMLINQLQTWKLKGWKE